MHIYININCFSPLKTLLLIFSTIIHSNSLPITTVCALLERPNYYYITQYSCGSFESRNTIIPERIDWREKNAVTPIKNQGHCGSCWAFSATGALEGAIAIETKKLVSLSEQELVNCVSRYRGCEGGSMDHAFEYVRESGICTETEEPYLAKDDICIPCDSQIHFDTCIVIESGNQLNLKEAVSRTPISVGIQADSSIFKDYKGGIITDKRCGTQLNHGVLIVGYGEEKGQKYWIVKNSWGPEWGEQGYVRIARNDSVNDNGVCGIAMQASYPSIH